MLTVIASVGIQANDDESDITEQTSIRKRMVLTGGTLALLGVLGSYGAAMSADIDSFITKLLFAAYAIPCLLFPLVAHGGSRKLSSKKNRRRITISLFFAMIVLVASATYGIIKNDFAANMIGPVFAIAFAYAGVFWATSRRVE